MSFGWINAEEFSFNTLLLMDRWIFNTIARNTDPDLRNSLSIALAGNPAVHWYIVTKCPEQQEFYDNLVGNVPGILSRTGVREAEVKVLDELDWAVVCVYPEIMEGLPYIAEWDCERLLTLTDFTGKTVLDIGSGTGRLAFAAAPLARTVYAIEPVDQLREYLREKKRRLEVENLHVADGTILSIPFQDEFFDIVMSGHAVGEDHESEFREMMRVTRPGGFLIDCPGEDDRKQPDGPRKEMLALGFGYSHYLSKTGGDVYRYWLRKPG